ncbi:MAG: dihydropteroate synthase [bacterium]|nr:dihydropteroate synthase [bacterium]
MSTLLPLPIRIGNTQFTFETPVVMGIANLTPDSFSDGGDLCDTDTAFKAIDRMISDGAGIIDIGAQSTRPGAEPLSEDDELSRLDAVITGYKSRFDTPLSLDTQSSKVAAWGLSHGVDMINDVSGLSHDPDMAKTVANAGCAVCIMHMQGTPQTMQIKPHYDDIIQTIVSDLKHQASVALKAGVRKIIIDPGIGFGKTLEHNLKLLHNMDAFLELGYPVLLGASRKSFIHSIDQSPTDQRLGGSIAAIVCARQQGIQFFRVHDVAASVQALRVTDSILAEGN